MFFTGRGKLIYFFFFFSFKMCGFNGGERAVTQDEMKDFRITQWISF